MNTSRKISFAALVLAVALSSPALAGHGGGGGHGGGYGWGWGGVAVGAALVSAAYLASYPYWYGHPYSYAYPYVVPAPVYQTPIYAPPPQQAMAAPAPATDMWYYCRKSKAYYPYVRTCAAGWERVPTIPPGQ